MNEAIWLKVALVILYLIFVVILYFIIARRLDVLTDRNEYKIWEKIIPLERMKDLQKMWLKFIFLLMFISTALTILILL